MSTKIHAAMKLASILMCIASMVAGLLICVRLDLAQAGDPHARLVLQGLGMLAMVAAFVFILVADTAHRALEAERRRGRRW